MTPGNAGGAAARPREAGKVAPWPVFWHRFAVFSAFASAFMLGWVALGTVIFHATLTSKDWVDAFRHASLLASGMGPAPQLEQADDWGKGAESLYSLFSGFVLLASAGVFTAPIVHRVFHHFHVDDTGE